SYAGQIVTFTFPHIGIVGTNAEDEESSTPVAAGMITKCIPGKASSWRADENLSSWLAKRNQLGVGGLDTRRLTRAIRRQGAPHVAIAYDPKGRFDPDELVESAKSFGGLTGADLASDVTVKKPYGWQGSVWNWPGGFAKAQTSKFKVAAVDYGVKRNILRCLSSLGCDVRVFPANARSDSILAMDPDGLFLSNGPGDPAATGKFAVPMIRHILDQTDIPIFGICLGHQMLALALGARTVKMSHGHHGANHPVLDIEAKKVEITSMNHGFAVDTRTLPKGVSETHVSLFDGSNCGLRVDSRDVFSVQYHPEASPGPQDSRYQFSRFVEAMGARRRSKQDRQDSQ
ncbi:MAG: glutamine-hydrolyzing carbamoyl-phosphate synthase small subunit, partial [Albidovulum sp.]|nr:glutamine-hydrolyzing carbamoyl-phosphate synthase small subunit [Albidovulum sp.]